MNNLMCTLLLSTVICSGAKEPMVISLHSGNGAVGSTDTKITMNMGPPLGAFGGTFGPADFQGALSGPPAFVVPPDAPWVQHLADPDARWISATVDGSTSQADSNTALYALPFEVDMPCITTAFLSITFAVDNELGDGLNEGVFLNGTPLIGTSAAPGVDMVASFDGLDVTDFIAQGENVLYFYQVNLGGQAGLLFSATLEINSEGAWENLGGDTQGSSGVPVLQGFGPLTGGSTMTLDVANAPANSLALLWISFASDPLNVLGGTVHAIPVTHQTLVRTDGLGQWTENVLLPAGIPACSEVWFQALLADPTVPEGIVLSNAVKATTP